MSTRAASEGSLKKGSHPLQIPGGIHIRAGPLGGDADSHIETILERAQLLELLAQLKRTWRKCSQALQRANPIGIHPDVLECAGKAALGGKTTRRSVAIPGLKKRVTCVAGAGIGNQTPRKRLRT